MRKLGEQWQVIVFTIIVTLIGNIVFSSWQINRSKVENSASIPYVEQKDNELRNAIEKKADKELVEKMSQQIEFLYQNEIKKSQKQ